MQTSKNELKLGVLYKVESPIVFIMYTIIKWGGMLHARTD